MYPEVEEVLAAVLATDGDFRQLCRDCRGYAAARGRADGVLFARMLLGCAQRWAKYKAERAKLGRWLREGELTA